MFNATFRLWTFVAILSSCVTSQPTTASSTPTKQDSPVLAVAQEAIASLKGVTIEEAKLRLCNDSAISATDDKVLCFVIGGSKLMALNLFFNTHVLDIPPGVNPDDLAYTFQTAIQQTEEMANSTGNAFLPPPLPGNHYSTLDFTHQDAAIHVEGFPCSGLTTLWALGDEKAQQFRYGDVALALEGYQQVGVAKRAADSNAGFALAFQPISNPKTGELVWDWFGWYVVQSARAPYHKLSDAIWNVYVCDSGEGTPFEVSQ